jgi:hypothetical protein
VRAALLKGGKPTKALMRVADVVDLKIRDAGFDPFKCVACVILMNDEGELGVRVDWLGWPSPCRKLVPDVPTRSPQTHKHKNNPMQSRPTKPNQTKPNQKRREGGEIVGVDSAHPVLQELRSEHGAAVADLVVEKKREVERYCPSGHYPTPVLFHEGRELRVPEAVARLVDGLREARERIRALEKIVPSRRGALYLGGWVGG